MRTRRLLRLVVLASALVIASCGDDGELTNNSDVTASDAAEPDIVGEWLLNAAIIDGVQVAEPAGADPGIEIEGGTIRGSAGCNSFNGQIAASADGALRLEDLSMTEMGCPGDLGAFEATFVSAIAASTTWAADNDGLTLTGPTSLLVFVLADPPVNLALEQTTWRLDTIFTGTGSAATASTPIMSLPPVDLRIDGAQVTLQSSDCGQVALPVTASGISEGPFSVRGGDNIKPPQCAADETNMTAAFDAVVTATGFMITERRLTLFASTGELVRFSAAS